MVATGILLLQEEAHDGVGLWLLTVRLHAHNAGGRVGGEVLLVVLQLPLPHVHDRVSQLLHLAVLQRENDAVHLHLVPLRPRLLHGGGAANVVHLPQDVELTQAVPPVGLVQGQ